MMASNGGTFRGGVWNIRYVITIDDPELAVLAKMQWA
jgi:hypothetical protein